MFTTIDKAIAGVLMGIISLLVSAQVIPEDLPYADWVGVIVPALTTGFTVWLVPNKS